MWQKRIKRKQDYDFLCFVCEDNIEKVKLLLSDHDYDYAISCAVERGFTKMVELLLTKQQSFSFTTRHPFLLAAKCGHDDIIKLLLPFVISVNFKVNGMSPIKLAILNGHHHIVNLLIGFLVKENNVNWQEFLQDLKDVQKKINFGPTSLISFCRSGQLDLVKFWVHGNPKNIDHSCPSHFPCIYYAVKFGHLEVVKFLFVRWKQQKSTTTQQHILCWAVKHNQFSILQYLARYYNLSGLKKQTILIEATLANNLNIVRWLSDKVDLNEDDDRGKNALSIAVKLNHLEIITFLLTCKLVQKDKSLLMQACSFGHFEVVRVLSEYFDANYIVNNSMTAFKASFPFPEITKWLFQNQKIDLNQCENMRTSNLLAAYLNGHLNLTKWLLLHGARFFEYEFSFIGILHSQVCLIDWNDVLSNQIKNCFNKDNNIANIAVSYLTDWNNFKEYNKTCLI